ncbi:MAG: YceD family protein [Saprospiraceae bacterium]|nr:YceD family protein [Saprospiraceae bacterium]
MELLEAFSIPISGLDDGVHHYHFEVDGDFFEKFENSPISSGDLNVEMELDKRSDMLVLWFDISGTIDESCDRCLASIDLPVTGRHRLIGKHGSGEEEADVFYFDPGLNKLNVAKFVYDFCCLSVPLSKTYDCRSEAEIPCDEKVLEEQREKDHVKNNPVWDQLKDVKFDN